jgi:phospholipid/cholesterol/gamma-HCH transport system ATP-binding protein
MEKILEVKHLAKTFDHRVVHKDINFSLRSGEILGLLGNSGTGKSVLLRSIIGLEIIDSGEIYYRNLRIDQLSEKKLFKVRQSISYAFQSGALFDSISVFENVAYPFFEHTKLNEPEIEKRVMDILRIVKMDEAWDKMPSEISGGMQKRVGLARSMALDPDILLYDEPTAGLDPVNVEMVLDVMRVAKTRGSAGIFVTHDIPAASKICDRFIIIKEGHVAFEGTWQDMEVSTDPFIQSFLTGSEK